MDDVSGTIVQYKKSHLFYSLSVSNFLLQSLFDQPLRQVHVCLRFKGMPRQLVVLRGSEQTGEVWNQREA